MKITIIATGFEKKPEDAMRRIAGVPTNPESPFRKESAKTVAAPKVVRPVAEEPAKKIVKPVQRPAQKRVDDDDDDILDMMKLPRDKK